MLLNNAEFMKLCDEVLAKKNKEQSVKKSKKESTKEPLVFTPIQYSELLPDPNPIIIKYLKKRDGDELKKNTSLYKEKVKKDSPTVNAYCSRMNRLCKQIALSIPDELLVINAFKPSKEEYTEKNQECYETVLDTLEDICKAPLDEVVEMIQMCEKLLDSDNVYYNHLALMGLTGRRPAEICLLDYKAISNSVLEVSNLSKKAPKEKKDVYKVKVITSHMDKVLETFEKLAKHDLTTEEINNDISRPLGRNFRRIFKKFKWLRKPYDLRSIYAHYLVYLNKFSNNSIYKEVCLNPNTVSETSIVNPARQFQVYLCHDSLNTQIHYQKYEITGV